MKITQNQLKLSSFLQFVSKFPNVKSISISGRLQKQPFLIIRYFVGVNLSIFVVFEISSNRSRVKRFFTHYLKVKRNRKKKSFIERWAFLRHLNFQRLWTFGHLIKLHREENIYEYFHLHFEVHRHIEISVNFKSIQNECTQNLYFFNCKCWKLAN